MQVAMSMDDLANHLLRHFGFVGHVKVDFHIGKDEAGKDVFVGVTIVNSQPVPDEQPTTLSS